MEWTLRKISDEKPLARIIATAEDLDGHGKVRVKWLDDRLNGLPMSHTGVGDAIDSAVEALDLYRNDVVLVEDPKRLRLIDEKLSKIQRAVAPRRIGVVWGVFWGMTLFYLVWGTITILLWGSIFSLLLGSLVD
ncbi:MAG: hypothetical protein OXG08_00225 [Gammaproteobacteria bacterium]|nr:hypothetical protein [Gammaproteobacteria bacterium]